MSEYKFNCDKCDFHAHAESAWLRHVSSILHQTGKRKIRSDKKTEEKCPKCEYKAKSSRTINMIQHILNTHSTPVERKAGFKYYCECCDFGCFAKPTLELHYDTYKHKYKTEVENK